MAWKIKEAVKIAEKAGIKALRTGAEMILEQAINEAPVESGTLRRSGVVSVGLIPDAGAVYEAAKSGATFVAGEGSKKAVYISFSTPYARRQHEELGYSHPLGGKAKYLEDPYNRNKAKVMKYAELVVKKALKDAR